MSVAHRALEQLRHLGYVVWAEGDKIRACHRGDRRPQRQEVEPLLETLRACKSEALAILRRASPLTCYECGYFRPARASPNPTQAWGYCRCRSKGRYGVAKTCEAYRPGGPGANLGP